MKRFDTTATDTPGKGHIVCQCFDQETRFSRVHAQYPLKFIPTKAYAERLAVVYMLGYGGGVVSGDKFDITIDIQPQAILLLLTQGHTKIFKDRAQQHAWMATLAHQAQPTLAFSTLLPPLYTPQAQAQAQAQIYIAPPSQQCITATVEAEGSLLILPDPVSCFRDASFQSHQVFHLADSSSQLVLLDWFTSGRMTRENWSFRHYMSCIDVWVGKRRVLKDHMLLEDEEYMRTDPDTTSYAARLGPYTCFATLVIISSETVPMSPLQKSIQSLQERAEKMRMRPNAMQKKDKVVLWSTSPLLQGRGLLVRLAGMSTEQVRDFVKYECLAQGLKDIVGEGMFSKVLA
ncbi:UreD urease accessory protein-domain-containing protein [Spinellus fusiger]|nr:UreD urease accessory protein-domain-containing protein [Spinellus fusiger]